jgi:ketosteroid isomerase-like protein
MTLLSAITFTILVLSIGCLFSSVVQAQSKEEKEVAEAVESLRKAMISGERKALETIVANELTYGHSNAKIEDKKAFVEAFVSGASDFTTIDLTEQTITISDNTAIVRHKLHAETNDNGKPGVANLAVLLVWQKQQGQWKLIARQACKLV